MTKPNFLPDINEYLEQIDDNLPIELRNLDELLFKIRASTGLDIDSIKIIVRTFFQEIRTQVLKGNIIQIKSLGKMFVGCPKTGNKIKIFIKFKPSKRLIRKINDDRT